MKKLSITAILSLPLMAVSGCARPGEMGWTPAYTAQENAQRIARVWDYDGKQLIDDTDYVFFLDEPSHLTIWNVR